MSSSSELISLFFMNDFFCEKIFFFISAVVFIAKSNEVDSLVRDYCPEACLFWIWFVLCTTRAWWRSRDRVTEEK